MLFSGAHVCCLVMLIFCRNSIDHQVLCNMHMADARNPLEIQSKRFLFEPDQRGDRPNKKKQSRREDPSSSSSSSSSDDENGQNGGGNRRSGNTNATSSNPRGSPPSRPRAQSTPAPSAPPPPSSPQFTPTAPPPHPWTPQSNPHVQPPSNPQFTPSSSPFGAAAMGATSTPNQSNTSPLRASSTFFNASSIGGTPSAGHSSFFQAGPSQPSTSSRNNLTNLELSLLNMQQNTRANIWLEVPLMSNGSRKACWFSSALRMLIYHQRKSRTGPPIRVNNIPSRFAALYQDVVLFMASNFRTVDPLPLLQTFAEEFLSHLPLNTVMTREHEPDLVFMALRGFQATATRPPISRCQYFGFAQPVIKTVTVNSQCCGQLPVPPEDTRYEGYVTVRLPENGITSLSNAIHNYFNNPIHLQFRCHLCGANVIATKRDSLVNAPDALPILVYWTPPAPANPNQAPIPINRPRILLQDNPNIPIATEQEGVINYKATSSSLHFGSHLSGHYVFNAFKGKLTKLLNCRDSTLTII